jgi:opacity protein-like surface antigen
MRTTFILIFICLVSTGIHGQSDYYLTNSMASIGVKLVDNGDVSNSRCCTVKNGEKDVEYSPYAVKEYGFGDGRVYVSRKIQLPDSAQKVFLEILVKGKKTLYYYRGKLLKTFFVGEDSTQFVELPKNNAAKTSSFRDQLSQLTSDCPKTVDAIRLSIYRKRQLTEIMNRYNDCELKPFPFLKLGLTAGYGMMKLSPTNSSQSATLDKLDFTYTGGFTVGLFADQPLLLTDFSLHAELYYSKYGYSYNKMIDSKDVDFVANISSLKIPLMIRYAYPSNYIRPFINAGGIAANNFRNKLLLYKATLTGNTIETTTLQDISAGQKFQFGYTFGGGIEYNLNYRNHLFIELRYSKLVNPTGSEQLDSSEYHIITGINF